MFSPGLHEKVEQARQTNGHINLPQCSHGDQWPWWRSHVEVEKEWPGGQRKAREHRDNDVERGVCSSQPSVWDAAEREDTMRLGKEGWSGNTEATMGAVSSGDGPGPGQWGEKKIRGGRARAGV